MTSKTESIHACYLLNSGRNYLVTYNVQKETTAKTWYLRNLTEGRPRTWSIIFACVCYARGPGALGSQGKRAIQVMVIRPCTASDDTEGPCEV